MKYITTTILAAIFGALLLPLQTLALSCMPPDMMLDDYVNDSNYTIIVATAGEMVEHVSKSSAEEFMYDEGYTGQRIAVSESLKGYVEDDMWVYWNVDSTWQYLCAGAPPEAGTENLYILRQTNEPFSLVRVSGTYPVDSELASDIKTALTEADIAGTLNESNPKVLTQRLTTDLKQMIFILRIKLAEWRFWLGQ